MKKIVYIFLLLAAAAGMSIYQPACSRTAKVTIEDSTVQSAASGKLSPSQAQELAARYPDGSLAILDVRTPKEFAQGHAPAAINIPVQELQDRLAEVPPSPLLILCRSGVRAGNAYGIILSSGRPAEGIWYLKGYTDYSGGGMRFHE